MDNDKFNTLMYFLIKEASSDSFNEFLDDIRLTIEDYNKIKEHLEITYGIKMYI